MSRPDKIIQTGDILTAIALLSRLPVRADFARGASAAWAYPLAGAVVAALAAAPTALALAVGVPPMLSALIWTAAGIILTGAMHEDGLADCADGFWGGWEPARRLDIMKDSHIGAYGVIALCLSLAARWLAVGILLQGPAWIAPLLAVALLSRATMPALMAALPHSRDSGLSHAQGRASPVTAMLAAGLAVLGAFAATGLPGLGLAILAAFCALGMVRLARAKIGGQTGDVLGATQQVTEIVLLIALTTTL